jgi:hypothetical protein
MATRGPRRLGHRAVLSEIVSLLPRGHLGRTRQLLPRRDLHFSTASCAAIAPLLSADQTGSNAMESQSVTVPMMESRSKCWLHLRLLCFQDKQFPEKNKANRCRRSDRALEPLFTGSHCRSCQFKHFISDRIVTGTDACSATANKAIRGSVLQRMERARKNQKERSGQGGGTN